MADTPTTNPPPDRLTAEELQAIRLSRKCNSLPWDHLSSPTQIRAVQVRLVDALLADRDALEAERNELTSEKWNAERVIEWLDNPQHKPAIHAFTAGNERQIAYRFERLETELQEAQAKAKPDYSEAIREGIVGRNGVESFRSALVEAVRARTIPENARDGHPLSDAGYNLAIDDVVELIQSFNQGE